MREKRDVCWAIKQGLTPIFTLTNKVETAIFSPPLQSLDVSTFTLSGVSIALSSRHETKYPSSIVTSSPAFH